MIFDKKVILLKKVKRKHILTKKLLNCQRNNLI